MHALRPSLGRILLLSTILQSSRQLELPLQTRMITWYRGATIRGDVVLARSDVGELVIFGSLLAEIHWDDVALCPSIYLEA